MRIAFYTLILSLSPVLLFGQDAEEKTKEGHSHQGHAFNEGPRQAGPLLGNTGEVHLPITTSWDQGQAYFDQGVGQLHGFWYYEAERSFRNVLAHDPNCVMAYWGLAVANWENEKRSKEFISKAKPLREKVTLTPLECAYFDAYARYFSDEPKNKAKRKSRLITDLETIIIDHPDDLEAKAFFVCHQWQFNKGGQKNGGYVSLNAILDQIFAKSPMHPAHHYRIHLWDKKKANKAIDSAVRLGSTASNIAHMWHMPSHIYDKTGRRHDATWHLEASARLDHRHMMNAFILPDEIHNYGHNNSWLSRNLGHLGDSDKALSVAHALLANPRHPEKNLLKNRKGSSYSGHEMLVRLYLKFELWKEALQAEKDEVITIDSGNKNLDFETLQLFNRANYSTGNQKHLKDLLTEIEKREVAKKKEKKDAEDKARKEGIKKHGEDRKIAKDKKDPVEEAVTNAGKKFKGDLDKFTKLISQNKSFLAELEGNQKKAAELTPKTNDLWEAQRLLKLGHGKKETLEKAVNAANSTKEEAVPLANAIALLAQLDKKEDARKAFDKLRSFSSQVNLKAPPFARLAPLAKEFSYPTDWRIAHVPAGDLLPRPKFTDLGPLHWAPPTAPDFSLPNQYGKEITLSEYRGKPLILIFYLGAGCLHCTEQLTTIADRYSDFEKAALPVLAISTDVIKDLKESQDNYSKGTIPFPIVSDHSKKVFKGYTAHDDFEKEALHGTFVLDGKGRVLWNDISADPFMDLDFLIKEARRLLKIH
ncbi:peroxiredoxin family protein [bacterium]|nr:peroxiredoxin family protein [bacterium]